MKAEITSQGLLWVSPESDLEIYALKMWWLKSKQRKAANSVIIDDVESTLKARQSVRDFNEIMGRLGPHAKKYETWVKANPEENILGVNLQPTEQEATE